MSPSNTVLLAFWAFFGIFIVIIIIYGIRSKDKLETKAFMKGRASPSQWTPKEQMDADIRLPYKRFKELYPSSTITYQEYKRLQTERAFKRAVSSEKNKRMVR